MCVVLTLVLFTVFTTLINANDIQFCGDFKPQVMVDIDKLMGNWFGIEMIFHVSNEKEWIKYHDVCPTVSLRNEISANPVTPEEFIDWRTARSKEQNLKHEQAEWDNLMKPLVTVWREVADATTEKPKREGRRYTTVPPGEDDLKKYKKVALKKLHLTWNDDGIILNYSLRYNSTKPGYWMSFGTQNGTMAGNSGYRPFVGTIQVLKAVRNHIILTFCHIHDVKHFFSFVLAREPKLSQAELHHVHEYLKRKHLQLKHVKRMCLDNINSGATVVSTGASIYLLNFLLLSFIWPRIIYSCR